MSPDVIQKILIFALPVIFAITVHEAAHGYVARALGDDTAAMMGRVTLNPMRHIDPIGTIVLPLVMLLTTSALPGGPFVLGYAKPVPVNYRNLRQPRRDSVLVAAAGPVSNLVQALLWTLLLVILVAAGVGEKFFIYMANAGVLVNLVIAVFNLFPVPPLDGGRVAVGLLPYRLAAPLARLEPFGFFIVLFLAVTPVLNAVWIAPLVGLLATGLQFFAGSFLDLLS